MARAGADGAEETSQDRLRRDLGPFAITAYGVGGMLGGGIYALVGPVASRAGGAAWLSFAAAMLVAAPTALTYAELSSRFPRSGGEAWYCEQGYRRRSIAFLAGWVVLGSGLVSMATLAHAFAGYLQSLWPAVPTWIALIGFLSALGAVNWHGIRSTSRLNIGCTAVELGGLLLVIAAGAWALLGAPAAPTNTAPSLGGATWSGVLPGAALAFYAFIGFEDMVNVAEEVRAPRRNLPRAIMTALIVVSLVYMAVCAVATRVVPAETLAASEAPLMLVVRRGAPAVPDALFSAIALFAVANTALLNFVMASRLIYGMADRRLLPGGLGVVHGRRRVPHRAIAAAWCTAVILALAGTLEGLAGATSLLLLVVFAGVNGALLRIKRRDGRCPDAFHCPGAVPVAGIACCLGLAIFSPPQSAALALGVVLAGMAVHAVLRLR